ncbi:hypothetical protein [Bernardetia sp.]|uniref:hypothetical protein n=1 Tax=Bernardetia sp. TaxID=1937974 RepID=UPI0025B7D8A2|nr:hypothetical protein [Bernardetia sp.]
MKFLFTFFCFSFLLLFISNSVCFAQQDSTSLEIVITEDNYEENDSTMNVELSEAIVISDSTISPLDSNRRLIRPTKNLAQLQSEYTPYAVTAANVGSLEPEELEGRFRMLEDIRRHLRLNIRWRTAYGAKEEDLKGETALMNQLRIGMALAEIHAKEERQRRADEAIKDLLNTNPEQMYDKETLKLNNPNIINTLKENIFYSSRSADFNSVALGTVLPNCKDFGLHPHTRATGYRLGIGDHTDKYNLLILRLHTGEMKAFLWDDVYAKIVDVM